MTNGDRIRSMTNDEVANIFGQYQVCDYCSMRYKNCRDADEIDCREMVLKWLNSEMSNDES